MRAVLSLALLSLWQLSAAAELSCVPVEPLKIRVRFAGEDARDALLESTAAAGLRLLDAKSREQIWSGGQSPANSQRFADMEAGFGASLAALHVDADGVHDIVYAGDRAGRIWRLELRSGMRPDSWMQASVIADLGVPGGGRGFIAPPDVARIVTASGQSWLNISLGTANTGEARSDHRFFVVRDSPSGRQQSPLVESDLELLLPPAGISRGNSSGYRIAMGSAQVLAQALTVNGRIHFVAVENSRNLMTGCPPGSLPAAKVELSVTVLRAQDGSAEVLDDGPGNGNGGGGGGGKPILRRALAAAQPAASGVVLASTPPDPDGRIPCMVGDERVPVCALDTRPKRTWWRREDAD